MAVAGGPCDVEYGAEQTRADEPSLWMASIEQTMTLTGWRPEYDLRRGVEAMWTWFTASTLAWAA
jgi:hypothetical protein